jgi:alcohol dehydrogenase class IV
VAFFYKVWASYSWRGRPDRFARLTALLDPTTADWPIEQAAAACADYLAAFIARIGLRRRLAEFDVKLTPADVAFLAERVSGDLRVNPVPVDPGQVANFFRNALESRPLSL